jgi:hypothetical protein
MPLNSHDIWSYAHVAISAVDWSTSSRLKGYFCLLAALGAHHREHLSRGGTVAREAVTLGFPGCAARWTALGIVGVAFRGKQLLFAGAEGESRLAVKALEGLVHKAHGMTSFLEIFG